MIRFTKGYEFDGRKYRRGQTAELVGYYEAQAVACGAAEVVSEEKPKPKRKAKAAEE